VPAFGSYPSRRPAVLAAPELCQPYVAGACRRVSIFGVFLRVPVQKKTGQEFAGPARLDSLRGGRGNAAQNFHRAVVAGEDGSNPAPATFGL
jgi:hypothetical protein